MHCYTGLVIIDLALALFCFYREIRDPESASLGCILLSRPDPNDSVTLMIHREFNDD